MLSELGTTSHQGNLILTLSKATQTEKYIQAHMGKDEFGFMARVNMFRAVAYTFNGQDLQRVAKEAESKQQFGIAEKLINSSIQKLEALRKVPEMNGGPIDMLTHAYRVKIKLKGAQGQPQEKNDVCIKYLDLLKNSFNIEEGDPEYI